MQLTKSLGRIGGLSVTAAGTRLILWRATTFAEVFLTEIDAETSRLKMARRLTLDQHKNLVDAWTPDSSAILFTSNRNGTFRLFRQAIDRTTPEVVVDGRNISLPRLNPDGTQILYLTGADPKDPAHMTSMMQVPLQGGPPRLLLQKPFIQNIQCARSPSKLCFLQYCRGVRNAVFLVRFGVRREPGIHQLPGETAAKLEPLPGWLATRADFLRSGAESHVHKDGRQKHA